MLNERASKDNNAAGWVVTTVWARFGNDGGCHEKRSCGQELPTRPERLERLERLKKLTHFCERVPTSGFGHKAIDQQH